MLCSAILVTETDVFIQFAPDTADGCAANAEEFNLSPKRYRKLCREFCLSEPVVVPFPAGEDFYTAVQDAHAITQAIREGARLLSFAPCSGRELHRKLTDRGFSAENAHKTVRFLVKKGFLNEAAQAVQYAWSVKDRYGPRRIRAYLRNRGYTAEAIDAAAEAVPDDETYAALQRILEKKYMPFPKEAYERKKAVAALMRRGYTANEIFRAIRDSEKEK